MNARGLLFGIVLLAAAHLSAQAPPAPQLNQFAGTWKADFHKQTWLVLTLVDTKATLTGTLTHSTELSADDEGDITSVGEEMSADKIVSVELLGETLHLTTRDDDGIEEHYTLVVTGKDTADLQPLSEGSATPKAFKLKRAPSPQK
jgi:hypothetical protein